MSEELKQNETPVENPTPEELIRFDSEDAVPMALITLHTAMKTRRRNND